MIHIKRINESYNVSGHHTDAIQIDGHFYTRESVVKAVCSQKYDGFEKVLNIIKNHNKADDEFYEYVLMSEFRELGGDISLLELDDDAEYRNSIPKEPSWRKGMITPRH